MSYQRVVLEYRFPLQRAGRNAGLSFWHAQAQPFTLDIFNRHKNEQTADKQCYGEAVRPLADLFFLAGHEAYRLYTFT